MGTQGRTQTKKHNGYPDTVYNLTFFMQTSISIVPAVKMDHAVRRQNSGHCRLRAEKINKGKHFLLTRNKRLPFA
jgi:hypothetical protein